MSRPTSCWPSPPLPPPPPDYRAISPCPHARLRWLNRSAASGVADAALDLDELIRSGATHDSRIAGQQVLFGVLLSLRAEHALDHDHQELERALSLTLGWTSSTFVPTTSADEQSSAVERRREGILSLCDRLRTQLLVGKALDPLLIEALGALFSNPPTSSLLNYTCPVAQVAPLVLVGAYTTKPPPLPRLPPPPPSCTRRG